MAKRRQGRAFWAKLISEFESNDERERHAAFAIRHGVRPSGDTQNRPVVDT